MRVVLAAALAAALASVVTPAASALPPECDRYADKPCFTFCEVWNEYVERLWLEPIPPTSGC